MEGKYIIIDLKDMDFMKDKDGNIKLYTKDEAYLTCGMYEFEDVWICKLVYNYIENDIEDEK